MFSKILIANRGEIALRILRACKELGIDGCRPFHRRRRCHACAPGRRKRLHRPAAARDSYLNIPHLLAACEITGADAVHPGYGFLSENARFAEILEAHNITFIGPTAEHIRIMGDKIQAKQTARDLGIPVVPGSDGAVTPSDDAHAIAREIGYPVLIKAPPAAADAA
jgi:acetyl-CoA carboxylase biotin carboxylase subunit